MTNTPPHTVARCLEASLPFHRRASSAACACGSVIGSIRHLSSSKGLIRPFLGAGSYPCLLCIIVRRALGVRGSTWGLEGEGKP